MREIISVVKTGPDRLVRSIEPGIGPLSSPVHHENHPVKKSVKNRENW